MSKQILKVATFGILGSKLIGGSKKTATEPTPAPPAVMPAPDDEAVMRARRRSIVQQMARKGRDSTNLTGDRLGG